MRERPSGNEALFPETLRTTEVVVEQYVRGRVRLALSGYYTAIQRLIDQVETDEGLLTHINRDAVRAKGVEFETEGRWPSGVLVRGSMAAQDAHRTTSGAWLTNAPRYLGTLQLAIPVWRRDVQLASDTMFTSSRLSGSGATLSGYSLTGLTATYRPVKWPVTIGASLYNVFDAEYQHPVGAEFVQDALTQDGRTFAVRLAGRF